MAETQQTMTEFTYATGETGIVGDRFSPSVVLFWLRTSVAASSMRVIYKSPNTLLGVIPLGSSTQTIPLRNIASVDTNTKVQPRIVRLGRHVLRRGPRMPVGQCGGRDTAHPARRREPGEHDERVARLRQPVRRQEQRQGVHPREGQAHAARAGDPAARLRRYGGVAPLGEHGHGAEAVHGPD